MNKNIIPFPRELDGHVGFSENALILPENLTQAQWEQIGYGLAKLDQSTQWWLGDWWAFGEHAYGERKALVESEDWTGPAFGTCVNAAIVCRKFESPRRRGVLSFEHHKAVAALDSAEADELLDWCEAPLKKGKKVRSVRDLQNQIVVRHNDALYAHAIKAIDEVLARWKDVDRQKIKETKGKILFALTGLVKNASQQRIKLTEPEIEQLEIGIAEEALGALSGDIKMLTELTGAARRIAERAWDYDQMIKAASPKLWEEDLRTCEKAVTILSTFIEKLSQLVSKL